MKSLAMDEEPAEPDDKLADLKAQLEGLQLILSIALNLLPRETVLAMLVANEKLMRSQNAKSGTLEMLRTFREIWERPPPEDAAQQ